jgi:hypothetical protein
MEQEIAERGNGYAESFGTGGNLRAVRKFRKKSFAARFAKEWRLHVLMLQPVICAADFRVLPHVRGAESRSRNMWAKNGIWGSEWVGMKPFAKFFSNYQFKNVIWNSLRISVYFPGAGFPVPILLALMIKRGLVALVSKDRAGWSTYAPYFISTIVLIACRNQFLSTTVGLYGSIATHWASSIPEPAGEHRRIRPHLRVERRVACAGLRRHHLYRGAGGHRSHAVTRSHPSTARAGPENPVYRPARHPVDDGRDPSHTERGSIMNVGSKRYTSCRTA